MSLKKHFQLALDSTAGAALIPEDLAEGLTSHVRELSHLFRMVPSKVAKAQTHEFNLITAFDQGSGFEGESAVTVEGEGTYTRETVTIKILRQRGSVTGFMQSAAADKYNAYMEELGLRAERLARQIEYGLMWGDATADPYQFDGLDPSIVTNRLDAGQNKVTLSLLDSMIDSIVNQGMMVDPAKYYFVMSPTMRSAVASLQDRLNLNRSTLKTEIGVEAETYRGIPILLTQYCAPNTQLAVAGTAQGVGGSMADGDYEYVLTCVTERGEQIASTRYTQTVAAGGGTASIVHTLPAAPTGSTPFLWKLYRTDVGDVGGALSLVGSFAGRTYNAAGTVTGTVATITDTLNDTQKAALARNATDSQAQEGPLEQSSTGIRDEVIYLVRIDPADSFYFAHLPHKSASKYTQKEQLDRMVTFYPLAITNDSEAFLVMTYLAIAFKGELYNSVLRRVRAA